MHIAMLHVCIHVRTVATIPITVSILTMHSHDMVIYSCTIIYAAVYIYSYTIAAIINEL